MHGVPPIRKRTFLFLEWVGAVLTVTAPANIVKE